MSELTLNQIVDELRALDVADLACTIGALSLSPDHAGLALRLERAATVVSSLPCTPHASTPRPRVSDARLLQLVNEAPIADWATQSAEDPPEDLFTDSLTFVGGSYTVFPGNAADSSEILRTLLDAIFHTSLPFPATYRTFARALTFCVLRVSDSIAAQASIARMTPSELPPEGGVRIPSEERLVVLKTALSFSDADLRDTLDPVDPEVLDELTQEFAEVQLRDDDITLGSAQLYKRPFLRCGDEVFVVLPTALVASLTHALVLKAINLGLADDLVESYRLATKTGVLDSLRILGHHPLGNLKDEPAWAREFVLSFDADKALHLLVLTDDLGGYDDDAVLGEWDAQQLAEPVSTRLLEGNQQIRRRSPEVAAILHLVVVNGLGRAAGLGFSLEGLPDTDRVVTVGASELGTIARLEVGNSLALWQFVKARNRLRETTHVLAFSTLDEFGIYWDAKHSFYLSDDGVPTALSIAPASGAHLRQKVAADFDAHGVRSWGGPGIVEVFRLYGGTEIPLYVPDPFRVEEEAVLYEDETTLIWVHEGEEPPDQLRYLLHQFCEAIAYWLWQVSPGIRDVLRAIDSHVPNFSVRVRLVERESWHSGASVDPRDDWLMIDSLVDGLDVKIHGAANVALMGSDNAGERTLVGTLIQSLIDFSVSNAHFSGAIDIPQVVDAFAPLGLKKKILTLDVSKSPELAPGRLPRVRVVQDADASNALDGLGAHVGAQLSLSEGDVPLDRRVALLNAAVRHFFQLLERRVAELSADGLLEFLVAHHEAVVREHALLGLTLPTRLACFPNTPGHSDELRSRSEQFLLADLAGRFLIEYVAAQPPSGPKRITLELYDELMAVSSEIFDKGTFSDTIHLLSADIDLSILPSGRIGTDRAGEYLTGFEAFRHLQGTLDLRNATTSFEGHWDVPSGDRGEEIEQLDAAAAEEFGFTMTQAAQFLGDLMQMAMSAGVEPCVQPLDTLRASLATSLGAHASQIDHMLDFFSLTSRHSFVPHGRWVDVAPWIFNRPLSYIRRPLLRRVDMDGNEAVIWGLRHLSRVGRYLLDLCTSGRLKSPQSEEMRAFITRMRGRESRAFEDRVAALFEVVPSNIVRQRVKRIAGRYLERSLGQSIGDVDVLVADLAQRSLLAVEAKDLELGRTPRELAHEIDSLFVGQASAAHLHTERVDWLRAHLADVLRWLEIPDPPSEWTVEGLIVLSRELMSPLVQGAPLKTTSLEALQRDVDPSNHG